MEAAKETKFDKGSLGDEDDARTLNTLVVQGKCTIPHLTRKTNSNIIECCNNNHQGAPPTSKQTCIGASDLRDDQSRYLCYLRIIFLEISKSKIHQIVTFLLFLFM